MPVETRRKTRQPRVARGIKETRSNVAPVQNRRKNLGTAARNKARKTTNSCNRKSSENSHSTVQTLDSTFEKTTIDSLEMLQEGDYDSEDLRYLAGANGDVLDFVDPDEYLSNSTESGETGEYDENPFLTVFQILGSFLEYDGQSLVEVLAQIRDSMDANAKCMVRVSNELRQLQNLYMHVHKNQFSTPFPSKPESSDTDESDSSSESTVSGSTSNSSDSGSRN